MLIPFLVLIQFVTNVDLMAHGSPHDRFRYLADEFGREVCDAHGDLLQGLPAVPLHGDLHIEQLAQTSTGWGLTDFDHAVRGAPLFDLLRLATSLRIAMPGLPPPRSDRAVLEAYRKGLEGDFERAEPRCLSQSVPSSDTHRFLAFVESLIDPPTERERTRIESLLSKLDINGVGRAGVLRRSGVGSRRSERYLAIKANQKTPTVIELKRLDQSKPLSCVSDVSRSAEIVLASRSTLGFFGDPYFQVFDFAGERWLVQSWRADYGESSTDGGSDTIQECACAAANELGRRHREHLPAEVAKRLSHQVDRRAERFSHAVAKLSDRFRTFGHAIPRNN